MTDTKQKGVRKLKRFLIMLEVDTVNEVDQLAKANGTTRSAIIRQALNRLTGRH